MVSRSRLEAYATLSANGASPRAAGSRPFARDENPKESLNLALLPQHLYRLALEAAETFT